MPGIGIMNRMPSILRAGAGLPYPIEDLTANITMSTHEDDGTTFYVNSRGTDIPVVGTDGGEDILDFSVLEDDRFNKGAVVGNSEGFPEYWDSPWNAYFYYDDTSAATLYNWKVKDFHYAKILEQSASVDNVFFLKAKATAETSNEISESYGLLVYENSLTDSNLTRLKSWIRVHTFYGDNEPLNSYFDLDSEGDDVSHWVTAAAAVSFKQINNKGSYSYNSVGISYRVIYAIIDYKNASALL